MKRQIILLAVTFFTVVLTRNVVKAQLDTNGLKVGDIAPNAKILDAGYCLNYFNEGSAVIIKGTAEALIDSKGEFIFPPNQYSFGASSNCIESAQASFKTVYISSFHQRIRLQA